MIMKGEVRMEGKLQLAIRTVTHDRQDRIAVPLDVTIDEIMKSVIEKWNLSSNYEYILRCERLGSQLAENMSLQQAGIQDGDILEIQPLADAG
jgi:uncharacterized ubiquitin-like protein YukD